MTRLKQDICSFDVLAGSLLLDSDHVAIIISCLAVDRQMADRDRFVIARRTDDNCN